MVQVTPTKKTLRLLPNPNALIAVSSYLGVPASTVCPA